MKCLGHGYTDKEKCNKNFGWEVRRTNFEDPRRDEKMIIAMLIKFQPDATVSRYLFTAKSLYMFRVSQHPSSGALKTVTATSGTGHNIGAATSLQRGLIRPPWSDFAVNTYLHTVASGWFLLTLNYDARNHELKKMIIALYSTPAQPMAHGQHAARATVISCPRRHLK